MRTLVTLTLGMVLFGVSASADVRVITDIDDTAKITDVGDPLPMIWNGLFSKRAFTGMRELYLSFAIEKKYAIDYVTGTPDFLAFRARRFLRSNNFPEGDLYTKPLFKNESLRDYKIRVVRSILDANPKDVVILVGDDTQADFDVYDDVYRYAPDRVLAIYIRKVTNHKLPPSAYAFLTAFDIARTEYVMGRFSVEEAAPVALAIVGERKDTRIVPKFSYCPVHAWAAMDPRIEEWNNAIDARLQKICRGRAED
ncbi:MAG: DUF2183 domain-containing protein [Bdellovibrionales bacterium]|nr:DUF2183 domain-containing protein [Bdellovibrionales bacterium]